MPDVLNSQTVCVDVGARLVRMCVGRGQPRVAAVPLAPNVIADGTVLDRGTVVEALKKLMKELQVRGGGPAAILLPASRASILQLEVPAGPDQEEALAFEIRHALPDFGDELILSHQFLGGSSSHSRVLVVGAPRRSVAERSSLLEDAGLSPRVVDVDILAMMNSQERAPVEWTAHVLLGHDRVAAVAAFEGRPHICLCRASGSGHSIEASLAGAGLPERRIRALLEGDSPSGQGESEAMVAVVDAASREIGAIAKRLIELCRADSSGLRLILGGGGATIPGLGEALGARFGASVSLVQLSRWRCTGAHKISAAAAAPVVGLWRRCQGVD